MLTYTLTSPIHSMISIYDVLTSLKTILISLTKSQTYESDFYVVEYCVKLIHLNHHNILLNRFLMIYSMIQVCDFIKSIFETVLLLTQPVNSQSNAIQVQLDKLVGPQDDMGPIGISLSSCLLNQLKHTQPGIIPYLSLSSNKSSVNRPTLSST